MIGTNSLKIIQLSRDRPSYLREALQSAAAQAGERIEITVSDNSEHDDVARMLAGEFPHVSGVRRKPLQSAFDHFRNFIEEARADPAVMSHHDEALLNDYVVTLNERMEADPTLWALCCNAVILRGSQITDEFFAPAGRSGVRPSHPKDMLRDYFSLSLEGPMPFPGYLYRCSAVQGQFLDRRHGSKHSYVLFLLKVQRRGSTHWLDAPVTRNRMYRQNDVTTEAVVQLLRNVYSTTCVKRRLPLITQHCCRPCLGWWRSSSASGARQPWRQRVIWHSLVIRTAPHTVTWGTLWQRLPSKQTRQFLYSTD